MKTISRYALFTLSLLSTTLFAANQPNIVNQDSLKWQPANGLKGAEVAVISGNPEKKGPFIARVKLPANFEIPVHMHHINEYDTILSGAIYLGTGKTTYLNNTKEILAGSFVMIPAKLQHYAFTKEETILQINGMGPWGMVYKPHHA